MTGEIRPARCNSHLCPECSPLHQMTARQAIEQGLVRRLHEHHEDRVLWLTLTDTARGDLDLPGLRRKWQAMYQRLQRLWGADEYAVSVEFQVRGALHPHACIGVAPEVARDLEDRKSRSSYRRRMHELRPMAVHLGWGQMVDAVTIDTLQERGKVSRYAAKSVAGYATKEAAARFREAGARNVRPIRLSRGWIPGGLAAARRQVLGQPSMDATRVEGKWERIRELKAC